MATIASILVDGQDPSMPALRAWLANLDGRISVSALGLRVFRSLSELNAYVPNGSDPVYAFVSDGASFMGYRYNSGWVADSTFAASLISFVEPLADRAELAAQEAEDFVSDARDLLSSATEMVTLLDPLAKVFGSVEPGVFMPSLLDAAGNIASGIDMRTGRSIPENIGPTPLKAMLLANVPIKRGWNGLIAYGQSLADGSQSFEVISTVQPYANLTFAGGVRSAKAGSTAGAFYTAPGTAGTKPLVEQFQDVTPDQPGGGFNGGETICSPMANEMTRRALLRGEALAANVWFASTAAKQGTPISGLVKASAWYQHLLDHVREANREAIVAGKTYALHIVPWLQGEADAVGAVDAGRQAYYLTALKQLTDDINVDVKAITGQGTPVHLLIYQTPTAAYSDPTNLAAIALAQLQAAREHPLIHMMGPIFHVMRGLGGEVGRTLDGVHPRGKIQHWIGRMEGRAGDQLMQGFEPARIECISAAASATGLRVRFVAPQAPLVIDTQFMAAAGAQYGMRLRDDAGDVPLSNIRIDQSTGVDVIADIGRPVGANPVFRLGLDVRSYDANLNNGFSHNLRDSTADRHVDAEGLIYPLFHVAPALAQSVNVVEYV